MFPSYNVPKLQCSQVTMFPNYNIPKLQYSEVKNSKLQNSQRVQNARSFLLYQLNVLYVFKQLSPALFPSNNISLLPKLQVNNVLCFLIINMLFIIGPWLI
jgi:hypothetical protein